MFQLEGWYLLLWTVGTAAVALAVALIAHKVAYTAAERFAMRTSTTLDGHLIAHSRKPTKYLLASLVMLAVIQTFPLPTLVEGPVAHLISLGLIGSIGWLFLSVAAAVVDTVKDNHDIDAADNLHARTIRTQVQVMYRIVMVVVSVLTAAVMLMTFPGVKQFGQALFASAGIAGLVLGLAAQSTISNLLAGIQLALTQPIRIDDVVIVEGEWGRIEEIRTTYVVVRIWDQRRLVLPLSYFIQNPFQNWTRQTSEILGTVFFYVDYNVPMEKLREELHSCLKATSLWDGRVWVLQVTNTSERTIELRALVSAADASKAWDLRCYVREHMVSYLQKNYPSSLPKVRADVSGTALAARAS